MRTLYFDCHSGVSGDMVLKALIGLLDNPEEARIIIDGFEKELAASAGDGDDEHHHFHRSYTKVKELIDAVNTDEKVKAGAKNIYEVIARAESKVHGESTDTLHFHEVGRNRAIVNILGVSYCVEKLSIDKVKCSEIYDGHGTVKCAHGEIPVPVPAVMAMRENCNLSFREADVEGEMVTPSGLAMIIGLGAETGKPEGRGIRSAEGFGSRTYMKEGLKASVYEA